jgi:hypothetical protein
LAGFLPFADTPAEPVTIPLPKQNGTELAREGMALLDGIAHFLPEDLGETNRIFRFSAPNSGTPAPLPNY